MELTICERWTMYVPDPEEKWFLDWAVRAPAHAGQHLVAGMLAYQKLGELYPEADSAMEYFGGLGAHSLAIQEVWSPAKHVVLDYSTEAARHLATIHPNITAVQGDAYDPASFRKADIVGVDCGDSTAYRTREGEKVRALLDRVFAGEPLGVEFTDIAAPYLHLHRERYEAFLGAGTCATYETYLEALAARLEALYDYVMVGCWYDRWSAVFAFAQEGDRGELIPKPSSPVGLEIFA